MHDTGMTQSLSEMQHQFMAGLRQQDGSTIATNLMDKPVTKPGLRAYLHAYSARLAEVLEKDHPSLGNYLGDDLWHALCVGYIEKHPSPYRSLRNFGDHLPGYLLLDDRFNTNPEIAELAQLERNFLDCFDAPDANTIAFSDLIALDAEQWPILKLIFHPSLQLLKHHCNSMALWQAMKVPESPPKLVKENQAWFLWRDVDRISSFRSANDDEITAFDTFLQDGTFSIVCERLNETHAIEDVPKIALGVLSNWCNHGWVVGTR
jgi:Putative DNA-binding domain